MEIVVGIVLGIIAGLVILALTDDSIVFSKPTPKRKNKTSKSLHYIRIELVDPNWIATIRDLEDVLPPVCVVTTWDKTGALSLAQVYARTNDLFICYVDTIRKGNTSRSL